MKTKYVEFGDYMNWVKNERIVNATQFAFCSFIETSGYARKKLTQLCPWTKCRESLVTFVKDAVDRQVYRDEAQNEKNLRSSMDRGAAKLLVMFKRDDAVEGTWKLLEGSLNRSLRIMNFFEREVGWSASEIFKVRSGKPIPYCHVYVLFCPKQWIRSPYMLSLYTLLLRIGKFKCFDNFKTYKQFVTICNKLSTEALEMRVSEILTSKWIRKKDTKFYSWPNAGINDVNHLHYIADKIEIILENQDKLFGTRSWSDLYRHATYASGITTLCQEKVPFKDRVVKKSFALLCKEAGLSCDRKNLSVLARERAVKEKPDKTTDTRTKKEWKVLPAKYM